MYIEVKRTKPGIRLIALVCMWAIILLRRIVSVSSGYFRAPNGHVKLRLNYLIKCNSEPFLSGRTFGDLGRGSQEVERLSRK